jgi:DNA invertase Pin-like site-specific DNA recombinase
MAAVERDEISTVVVHSFSRFARSTTHLLNALNRFKQKEVHFVSISERIDTNSAISVAIFSILAAIAQLERDLIASRVKKLGSKMPAPRAAKLAARRCVIQI